MLEAAEEALGFVAGLSRANLQSDRQLTLALMKSIEIVGEAASQVSAATRGACPEVPWTEIVGMRNRLVHVYFDIDLDRLWDTTREDLVPLVTQLRRILARGSP